MGERVNQGEIHEEIQNHIEECKKRNEQYCGILAPWGHGKTENAVIGNTLDEIGKDVNKRIFIISNTDDNAKARIESITNYIANDVEYHSVYPHVKPADHSSWTKHKIIVARDSKSKDGTVEAYGVMTSGVGGRCDMLVFDDPVDMRNSVTNPALRDQVRDNIQNVWLSRLTPEGFALYIATIWHQNDATSQMMKNPQWKFLVMKISDDFMSIDCDSPFKGKYKIPLWKVWSRDRLIKRLGVIGTRAFNRGFRQQALSDEDRTFPSSEMIFRPDVGMSVVSNDWPRIMGVDPFGQWVILFTIAVNPDNHKRFPLEIIRRKMGPADTVNEIIAAYHRHNHQLIVCENNAAQEAIKQWALEKGKADLPIIPFTTGSNKANIDFGLPSVEVEFNNGAWVVPYAGIDAFDAEHTFNIWRNELMSHPLAEAWDTVMAMWFAREGARFLFREQEPEEDVVHGEDIGVGERVKIGNYE